MSIFTREDVVAFDKAVYAVDAGQNITNLKMLDDGEWSVEEHVKADEGYDYLWAPLNDGRYLIFARHRADLILKAD